MPEKIGEIAGVQPSRVGLDIGTVIENQDGRPSERILLKFSRIGRFGGVKRSDS